VTDRKDNRDERRTMCNMLRVLSLLYPQRPSNTTIVFASSASSLGRYACASGEEAGTKWVSLNRFSRFRSQSRSARYSSVTQPVARGRKSRSRRGEGSALELQINKVAQ